MARNERTNDAPTILFTLHHLGGSARAWSRIADRLDDRLRLVALDLPGFGDAAQTHGYSVAEMSDTISATIAAMAPERWMIAGHSMGAKVAAAIARRAEDGDPGLRGLSGVVLVAGSPPGPEPIPDADRATMLGSFHGDAHADRADAERYVANNAGPALDAAAAHTAVDDVLRMNRAAWIAWLERGSHEDWSARVGIVHTPALVIAGADDANLGPAAQRRLTLPHLGNARLMTVPNAKHLLPYEAPQQLADAIAEHRTYCAYAALIGSNRVGGATRAALRERAVPDDPAYTGAVLDGAALITLRAVIDRVVPQRGPAPINLAARIDRQLASGIGDGWRFAALPPDTDAYRRALQTLNDAANARHGGDFATLDEREQDTLLHTTAAGLLEMRAAATSDAHGLTATQMQLWFEDLRADAVKLYMAHPATLARIGYGGIANGGDGEPKSGFAHIGLGEREAWEPVAAADRAR